MAEWTRNTPWRQGHLLSKESAAALGLIHTTHPDDTIVIVASHDCDLTQLPEKEPQVEVIVGRRITVLDGNNTHAKSSRTLHIEFQGAAGIRSEFVITEKRNVLKTALADHAPTSDARLSPSDLATFQLWLASRYRRSAFPDEFENRLKEAGLHEKIANVLRPSGDLIIAIFFDVDNGQEIIHTGQDDVYILDIYILYSTENDDAAALATANAAKAAIEEAFRSKLFNAGSLSWGNIELRYVEVISEEAMTYRQSRLLKKWRLDHISMGADPQQPVSTE
jgi:hypothetical protein